MVEKKRLCKVSDCVYGREKWEIHIVLPSAHTQLEIHVTWQSRCGYSMNGRSVIRYSHQVAFLKLSYILFASLSLSFLFPFLSNVIVFIIFFYLYISSFRSRQHRRRPWAVVDHGTIVQLFKQLILTFWDCDGWLSGWLLLLNCGSFWIFFYDDLFENGHRLVQRSFVIGRWSVFLKACVKKIVEGDEWNLIEDNRFDRPAKRCYRSMIKERASLVKSKASWRRNASQSVGRFL